MFNKLMPQRREFFDLLAEHSGHLIVSANATSHLVNTLGAGNTVEADMLVREIDDTEHLGDKIKADVIALLHRSFITPLSRDEIHTLILELDKVLGALRDVANAVSMYNIQESTPEAREMAALSVEACQRLHQAVRALGDKNRGREAVSLCQEIDEIESKSDAVLKQAVTRLFRDGTDPLSAMKLREFYFLQENVLDCCEDAAQTIEEILIENS